MCAAEVVEAHSVAIAATGEWGGMRLIAKLRFVPSICRIEGGGWFSIALVGNELADKVLWHRNAAFLEETPRQHDSKCVERKVKIAPRLKTLHTKRFPQALVMLAEQVMTAASAGVAATEAFPPAAKAFL